MSTKSRNREVLAELEHSGVMRILVGGSTVEVAVLHWADMQRLVKATRGLLGKLKASGDGDAAECSEARDALGKIKYGGVQ